MCAQAMFGISALTALVSGLALFSRGMSGSVPWLDAVFLVTTATSLSMAVVFLGKRLSGETKGRSGAEPPDGPEGP